MKVACISDDLKCWGAWNTTCGHEAKDITPLIAWRREAWKEKVFTFLKGQILELFQRQCRGNFRETGQSAYEFSEHIDTILNWAELNWTSHCDFCSLLCADHVDINCVQGPCASHPGHADRCPPEPWPFSVHLLCHLPAAELGNPCHFGAAETGLVWLLSSVHLCFNFGFSHCFYEGKCF